LCPKTTQKDRRFEQFENLVTTKPPPVMIEALDLGASSDSDVPLFQQIPDDPSQLGIPRVIEIAMSEDGIPPVKKGSSVD
jgi:hypothetical protein